MMKTTLIVQWISRRVGLWCLMQLSTYFSTIVAVNVIGGAVDVNVSYVVSCCLLNLYVLCFVSYCTRTL
jgi:hypothetical protein